MIRYNILLEGHHIKIGNLLTMILKKSTNLPVESISMILLQGQGLITYNIELVFLVLQVGLLSS